MTRDIYGDILKLT